MKKNFMLALFVLNVAHASVGEDLFITITRFDTRQSDACEEVYQVAEKEILAECKGRGYSKSVVIRISACSYSDNDYSFGATAIVDGRCFYDY